MQIIAHRGCPKLILENTRKSFLKAIELNYDMIELDVQVTKDHQLVVFHDDTLEHLSICKSTHEIKNLNYSDLLSIPLLDGTTIPLLQDILNEMDQKIEFNLEIKTNSVALPLLNLIKDRNPIQPYLISSFIKTELEFIKKNLPNNPIAWLTENLCLDDFKILKQIGINHIHLSNISRDLELLAKIKDEQYICNVYTINEIQDYTFWKKMNVNGIFTDSSDIVLKHRLA